VCAGSVGFDLDGDEGEQQDLAGRAVVSVCFDAGVKGGTVCLQCAHCSVPPKDRRVIQRSANVALSWRIATGKIVLTLARRLHTSMRTSSSSITWRSMSKLS